MLLIWLNCLWLSSYSLGCKNQKVGEDEHTYLEIRLLLVLTYQHASLQLTLKLHNK